MLLLPPAFLIQAPAADAMSAMRFLQGEWSSGEGGGVPGKANAGSCSFTPDLDGKLLIRRSYADYPASGGRPAMHHEDRMVIYAEHGALKADYWDGESHVIHYGVQAAADVAVFTSLPAPGPRFRLTYHKASATSLDLTFEIAPPGKDFAPYLHATLERGAEPPPKAQ